MKSNFTVFKLLDYRLFFLMSLLLLFINVDSNAQSRQISGKIISADDNFPLPGVNVRIKGTTQGTVSNFDGEYSLLVEEGEVLEFSFIGMITQFILVSNQSKINVSLKADVKILDEIVKIGYGEQKKKEVSGAVAHVKSEALEAYISGDATQALQGQIAGVNVTTSGSPGADAVVQIRGVSTVSDVAGATEPLYVVDGIPQNENPRLAPSEIESMDILKDLASCAIYGTRGANGVILITTKKGEAGKLNVSLDASYGIKNITSSIALMNTPEQVYFDMIKERNRGANDFDNSTNLPIPRTPSIFQNNTDLSKVVIIDNQPTQNYNIGINGGSKGLTYNLTGGFFDDRGPLINSGFSRYNGRAGVRYDRGKWNISSSIAIGSEKIERTSSGLLTQTIRYDPYKPVLDPNSNQALIDIGGGASVTNSVLETMRMEDVADRDRMQGNISAAFEIIDGLKLNSNLGVSNVSEFRYRFKPFIENYDEDGILQSDPATSYVSNESSRRTSTSADIRLSYLKKLGNHKISAVIGSSYETHGRTSFSARKNGIVDNSIRVLDGAALAASATNGYNYTYNIIGTLGRITYDYKSKYMISVSGNYNGNSKFASDKKWKFFPSASAAWNVSEEQFWEGMRSVANNFKIRGSHGQVGGQSFLPYSDQATIQNGFDYLFGAGGFPTLYFGSAQQNYANGNIQWETSIQNNIGIDLGLLDNKIIITSDIYHTQKSDMLFPIQLPPSSGVTGADSKLTMNIGNMVNKGFELAATVKGRKKDFNWSMTGTFTKNQNEITSLNADQFIYTTDPGLINGAGASSKVTVFSEGYEAGAFFLYETDGVIKTEEQLRAYQAIKPDARMGDLVYRDTNNDGTITDEDRVYMGSGFSNWESGFIVNIGWKGFDFMMHWYAAIGHKVMNGSKAMAYSEGRHQDQVNTWNRANPNSDTPAWRGTTKEHDNFRAYTDLWLEDGSYLRLKNIQIGYTLPKRVTKRLGMTNCRFYVSAQNPITFTNYEGYDPEAAGNGVSSRGLDKGNYPISALYLTGFKLNF
ncbi:TonB-dependent receptor [Flammeovirga sp. EKP202]|uniref:SusC/RagA family TonB-linked outer membrane protein n=1 Tax=Flammeovirga sp. EKP202 TaxID=2770592 RepID=UPI00165FF2A8|nr:TonB-dependent receptor [Flammeovirga sp. EKP202]MBD0403513.1 TonB-dependent receptor [Flammeovirga sp. EKP202]